MAARADAQRVGPLAGLRRERVAGHGEECRRQREQGGEEGEGDEAEAACGGTERVGVRAAVLHRMAPESTTATVVTACQGPVERPSAAAQNHAEVSV
ncbi:hypothetical protein X551_04800 [Methylibium sp. T29]|nr:hypothetical protein X551_04800 [Methylibium sp. T29]